MGELFSLQCILFFTLLIYIYFHFYSIPRKPSEGFRNYPLLGTLLDLLRNKNCYLDWFTGVLRGCPTNTATIRLLGRSQLVTANALNVEHLLKTKFDNYQKGYLYTTFFGDFLGHGIFNSDGDQWKVQRKLATPEFHSESLQSYVMESIAAEVHTRLVPLLATASETQEILKLQDIFERFAFDNICKIAFDVDPDCLSGNLNSGSEFMRAFDDYGALSSGRFLEAFPIFWKTKRFLNIGSERKLKDSIKLINEFADHIIKSRMETIKKKPREDYQDLLSRFIQNHMNSPQFLRDIVISFLVAGKDTTSTAMTWFFWLLSSRPEVEQNILNELESIRVRYRRSVGDTYSYEQLRDMHYLQAAISEAMRLYPPLPFVSRICEDEDILPEGARVGKGWIVTYSAFAMARLENIWGENCDEYLPERWLKNGKYQHASPYRFPVFQAGPRLCLGKDMAYIQMKSIAASVIERFEVKVCDQDKTPEYIFNFTLRMKNGLPVRVKKRCL